MPDQFATVDGNQRHDRTGSAAKGLHKIGFERRVKGRGIHRAHLGIIALFFGSNQHVEA